MENKSATLTDGNELIELAQRVGLLHLFDPSTPHELIADKLKLFLCRHQEPAPEFLENKSELLDQRFDEFWDKEGFGLATNSYQELQTFRDLQPAFKEVWKACEAAQELRIEKVIAFRMAAHKTLRAELVDANMALQQQLNQRNQNAN